MQPSQSEKHTKQREYIRKWKADRYAANPLLHEAEKQKQRARNAIYMADPAYRERVNKKRREKMLSDRVAWLRGRLRRAKIRHNQITSDPMTTAQEIETPDFCPVLGVKMRYSATDRGGDRPSLDRIDNSKGYVSGNVRVISWRANRLKQDATVSEIEALLRYMKAN